MRRELTGENCESASDHPNLGRRFEWLCEMEGMPMRGGANSSPGSVAQRRWRFVRGHSSRYQR
jgi:hypothetical protein